MAGSTSDMGLIFTVIFGGLLCVGGIQLILLALIYLVLGYLVSGIAYGSIGFILVGVGYLMLNVILDDKGYYQLEERPIFNYQAVKPARPSRNYDYTASPEEPGQRQASPSPPPPPRYRYQDIAGQGKEPAREQRAGPPPPPPPGENPYHGYRQPAPRGPPQGHASYQPYGGHNPYDPYNYAGGYRPGRGGGFFPRPYRTVRLYSFIKYNLNIPSMGYLFGIFVLALLVGFVSLYKGGLWSLLFPPCFVIVFSFPSLMWISYVYHQGSRSPEPRSSVFKALLWGMFSTIPAGFINGLAGLGLVASLAFLVPVVVAPINEEFFKPLGLRSLRPEINNRIDGLIYGVTCGMGFAMTENLLYEMSFLMGGAAAWSLGSFTRGVGSTIIHGVGSGLIGFMYASYYLKRKLEKEGKLSELRKATIQTEPSVNTEGATPSLLDKAWKQADTRNKLAVLSSSPQKLVLAYLAAVLVHAGWNGLATVAGMGSDLFALGMIGIMFIYAGFMFLFLKYLIELAGGTMRFSY